MAKQKQPSLANKMVSIGGGANPSSMTLSELKAMRIEQRETSRRIEEMKLRLFQMSEQHMEQTIRLVKTWVRDESK